MKQIGSPDKENTASRTMREGSLAKIKMTLRALRHRNYRLFFAGQLISLIGTWMQNLAQSWLVYRLTGSSFLLGSINFASQIPIFLLAFVGGAVADRYDRHRVVIATQTASMILALILAVLTLTNTVRVWHIFVLSALLGVVNAFDMPTRQAFVVELVDKEDLMNAIALNSSVFNGARILGPAVAGALISGIGEGWCFFANGISYVAVIVGLLLMKLEMKPARAAAHSAISNVIEGLQYVRRARPIRALLLMMGLVSAFGMSYSVLMPIVADKILHKGAHGMGILMGATGLGALIGSLALAARTETRGLSKLTAYASAGFSIFLILFSISRNFYMSALILVPVGFSFMVQMACTNTLIQIMSPDDLRGRVLSTHVWMFMGMAPFGSFLAGSIAAHLGAPTTIMMGAVLCLGGAGIYATRLPSLRLATGNLIRKQADEPDSP
jgi:MFS family permease